MVPKRSSKKSEGIVKRVEEDSEEIIKDVEEILTTKKARRIEKYFIFFLYALVFVLAAYFLLSSYLPYFSSATYVVSASDETLTSNLNSVYFSKDVFGGQLDQDGKVLRMITSAEPFNLVFSPKKVVPEGRTGELQLYFVNPQTDIYLDGKLIVPSLEGYELVKEFEGESVWVKSNLTRDAYESTDTVEEFIANNYPGKIIYSFAEFDGLPIVSDYKNSTTVINTTFRDNLKLAVYSEGDLTVRFVKQDLNWYVGSDEYTVEISDYQGNVYYNKTFRDDGDNKDSSKLGEEKGYEIYLNGLDKNVYYVSFKKDGYNSASDSTLKNIEVSSNKVLILGSFLPITPFEFYVKSDYNWEISFNYWHTGKEQNISVKGTEDRVINLTEEWKNKKYTEGMKRGVYSLNLPEGDLWVYVDAVAINSNGWFYIPSGTAKKFIDVDLIVIDKDNLRIRGEDIFFKKKVNLSQKEEFKIQVLEGAVTFFEKAEIVLK